MVQNVNPSFTAGADVAACRWARMGEADQTVLQANADTDFLLGVFPLKAKSGAPVAVQTDLVADLEVSAIVRRGAKVGSDANGRGIEVVSGAGPVGGIALTAGLAPVSGVYSRIKVLVIPGGLDVDPSFITGAAVAASRFAKLHTAANQVVQAAGNDAPILGVFPRAVALGARAPVQTDGVADLVPGGAIAIGARLTSDSSGRGVSTTTAGHHVGAIALMAATGAAAPATIKVLVIPGSFGA